MWCGRGPPKARGNGGRQKGFIPKVPLSPRPPPAAAAPPIGASAPESGSQVWNGTSGALIAKATKKPRNSSFWTPGSIDSSRSASKANVRSEEHTSELQSRQYLVCRLLLEKKKTSHTQHISC